MEYLQNFHITNQMNVLRLICGLFFVLHIYAKFFGLKRSVSLRHQDLSHQGCGSMLHA